VIHAGHDATRTVVTHTACHISSKMEGFLSCTGILVFKSTHKNKSCVSSRLVYCVLLWYLSYAERTPTFRTEQGGSDKNRISRQDRAPRHRVVVLGVVVVLQDTGSSPTVLARARIQNVQIVRGRVVSVDDSLQNRKQTHNY
jgi:hypothetical protein